MDEFMRIQGLNQRLEWEMSLPAREGIMLHDGITEPRGSDYYPEDLALTLEQLQSYV